MRGVSIRKSKWYKNARLKAHCEAHMRKKVDTSASNDQTNPNLMEATVAMAHETNSEQRAILILALEWASMLTSIWASVTSKLIARAFRWAQSSWQGPIIIELVDDDHLFCFVFPLIFG